MGGGPVGAAGAEERAEGVEAPAPEGDALAVGFPEHGAVRTEKGAGGEGFAFALEQGENAAGGGFTQGDGTRLRRAANVPAREIEAGKAAGGGTGVICAAPEFLPGAGAE